MLPSGASSSWVEDDLQKIDEDVPPEDAGREAASIAASISMLVAVVDGQRYEAVAARHGLSISAVERRVKAMIGRLAREVGIRGVDARSLKHIGRIRAEREAVLEAVRKFQPLAGRAPDPLRLVSEDDIVRAAHRIRGRSKTWRRDVALFYMLFTTGARPLEVARLEIRDYLDRDGRVRRRSEVRAEVSISGRSRPLFFATELLTDAIDEYLRDQTQNNGARSDGGVEYRGLDPYSRLFLTVNGEGFQITEYGNGRRSLCRPMLETYRKIFRIADLPGATPLSVRGTIVAKLYERGADDDQICLLLGIADRRAVREMFPRTRPSIDTLAEELIRARTD